VDGYVLVFSIISRQSFDRIKQINESLLSALGDAVDIPRVLVGSICDLNDQRQVPYRVSIEIQFIDEICNLFWLIPFSDLLNFIFDLVNIFDRMQSH
jgi:GTPase SAR1 family protein